MGKKKYQAHLSGLSPLKIIDVAAILKIQLLGWQQLNVMLHKHLGLHKDRLVHSGVTLVSRIWLYQVSSKNLGLIDLRRSVGEPQEARKEEIDGRKLNYSATTVY